MPLTVEEQRELDELELKELEAKEARPSRQTAAMVTRANQAGGVDTARKGQPMSREAAGMTVDIALEAGIPALGQAITSPAVGTGITSAVGSGLSILGNLLAQGRRLMMGEQEEFSKGQVAQAGLTGAVPFAGPAKTAERLTHPLFTKSLQVATNTALQGGTGLAGDVLKTTIDEGRLPSLGEATVSTLIPGALGGGATVIGQVGNAMVTRGRRVADNASDFAKAGVKPTPGMLLPEELASVEQKVARNAPGSQTANRLDESRQSMIEALNDVAPAPREGSAIFDEISPLLGKISKTDDEIAKLNQTAISAREKVGTAFRNLRDQRAKQTGNVDKAIEKQALESVDEAFTANLNSTLDNAKELAISKVTGGDVGIDPATARTLFVEHVAKPLQAAFEEKSAQLYSLVDHEAKVFSAQPIIDKAEELTRKASGKLPAKLQSSVQNIRDMLGDEAMKVSLQDLRNARSELLKKVQMGQELGSYEEKVIKEVASEITSQIEKQAVTALGTEGGEALKKANQFYSETRGLFDNPGVEVLFSPKPGDDYVRKVINGMKESGIKSDEYVSLTRLADKIGESHPELAAQVKAQAVDNLRQSILFDAATVDPATSALKISGRDLTNTLDQLGRTEGTLETLGLGNREKVSELKRLFAQYPDAPDLTKAQWEGLLASPAFQEAKGAADLRPALAPFLATAAADAKLVRAAFLKNAGRVESAQRTFNEAKDTLKAVNGDLSAAKARFDSLSSDPVVVALNNPKLPTSGYNAFATAFFDPAANAVTNRELGEIVMAMRNGPRPVRETLTRLQERYIADRIAKYQTTPSSSKLLEETRAQEIARFFNPANPADAAAEIARAKAILDPSQFSRLWDFSAVAKAVDRFERLGESALKPGSYNVPIVGQLRRGFDAVADLYRDASYFRIARALADPGEFSRLQLVGGQRRQAIGQALQTGAQGTGRAVTGDDEPRR